MFFKQRVISMVIFILLFFIVLTACQMASLLTSQPAVNGAGPALPGGPSQPEEVPPAPPATALPLEEYMDQNFGFSLSVPEGYEVQSTFIHQVVFLAPKGTEGHRERAFLNVELAGDLTAEWLASQVLAENANLGTAITSAAMTIDGETAYILGQLPGQDLNRQVFVVREGFLYHLTFMPDDPRAGESYQQMESLYSAVMNSLHFLPDRLETPPVTSANIMSYQLEQALEARSEADVLRMLGDEFMVLDWTAPGVISTSYGRDEAASLVIKEHITQPSDLEFRLDAGWPDVAGSPESFTGFFRDESVIPVLVQGWGPSGSDEAVVILGRRRDGSLFWRGVLVSQGSFIQ